VAFAPQRLQLDPARGHVDRAQGMQVEAFRAAAAVGDQIDLIEAGPRIVPVGERADGDLLLEPAARVGRRGNCARAPSSKRAKVGRLACRTSLSTAGGRVTSPHCTSRSSNSGTKGCSRWAPMRPQACQRMAAAAATSGPYWRGRPGRGRAAPVLVARRNSRMAALWCMRVTATISSNSRCFSLRLACWYRSRCTAAYSRKLARVTAASWGGLVTVTSDLRASVR